MKFLAEIDVMPLKELLDPQGKTVANNLKNVDLHGIEDVRIGKHVKMWIEAESEEAAKTITDTACKKLLCNQIMENYTFTIIPA
ncbi:MAG: phosphoribosylformylglycinamidine synthase subunit PurS [Saprospiraceae bacterium]|jgi:phosphoribosylformylglycinamidine synthase PurS subunit|nr:phosphoribosylformylglycinamidine synthase subunit PurS [Saprospiraceae bacterium]